MGIWICYLTFLSLPFLICKIRLIVLPNKVVLRIKSLIHTKCLGRVPSIQHVLNYIGLAKKLVWVFRTMLQKNLNELFGQPNI